jgi:2-oxoglutarate ferredoxin oxidoreductase subunit beta
MRGFAFVEIVSQCPTAFGRRIGLKTAAEMLAWLKENSIPVHQALETSEQELEGKIVVGEFAHRSSQTFSEAVHQVVEKAMERGERN